MASKAINAVVVYYLFAGLILLTVFTVTSWRSSVDYSTVVYVDDDGMECPVNTAIKRLRMLYAPLDLETLY